MAKLTPVQAADKLIRRLSAATTDIRAGIESVKENPMEKAAASEDKMRAGVNEAIDSGKWKRGLLRVTLPEWKKAMLEKGVPRIAAGAEASRGKIEAFYAEFLPYVETVQAEIAKMPDVTLEDSIARAVHSMRRFAEFERTT